MLYLGLGGLELNTPDSKDMTRWCWPTGLWLNPSYAEIANLYAVGRL